MSKNTLIVLVLVGLCLGAQGGASALAESARTIQTTEQVAPSPDTLLQPGQWIEGSDFERAQRPYTIQRLTESGRWHSGPGNWNY